MRGKTHKPNDESHQNNISLGGKLCRCESKRVGPWHILPQSISISQIKTLNQDQESGNQIIVNHIKSKTPHLVKSKGQMSNVKCQVSKLLQNILSLAHPLSSSKLLHLALS